MNYGNETLNNQKSVLASERKEKINKFEPNKHKLPRFNIYGYQIAEYNEPNKDNFNILKEYTKSEKHLTFREDAKIKTQSLLKEKRKKEIIPDISFDLDGDGFVGPKDYFLSKLFDKDGDNKLNENEKKEAISKLSQGYEDNFIWGLEKTGSLKRHRILQKRGQFIYAEDFSGITNTYSKSPISDHIPIYKSKTDLLHKRKEEIKSNLHKTKLEWDKANPKEVPQEFVVSEYLIDNPKHYSVKQIKDENKVKAREIIGLNPEFEEVIKLTNNKIGVEYINNPTYKSQTELNDSRKKNLLQSLFKFSEKRNKNEEERLKERENSILRIGHKEKEYMTRASINYLRKKDINEKNQELFGSKFPGIHGGELPKFSKSRIDFWKLNPNYVENPKHSSNLLFTRASKLYTNQDQMPFSQVNNLQYPINLIKLEHTPIKKKEVMSPKINQINTFSNMPDLLKGKTKEMKHHGFQRYSNLAVKLNSYESIYNDDPKNRLTQQIYDLQPLYSSFSTDKIFKDSIRKESIKNERNIMNIEGLTFSKSNENLIKISKSYKMLNEARKNYEKQAKESQKNLIDTSQEKKGIIIVTGGFKDLLKTKF